MHFGKNNPKNQYTINGIPLESSDCEKDVGVWISSSLKPSEQCSKAAWTANKVLGLMSRSVLYRDTHIWPKLYMTYVRPYLEYAVPAWAPWLEKDLVVLEKVQERALKQITCLNHLTYPEKLKKLGILSIRERRIKADLCQVWKIIHKYDVDESTWFKRANVVNIRQSRQNSSEFNLTEPLANRDTCRQFFSIRVVKPWNSLPEHVKSARTIGTFKNLYDKHIKATANE